MIDVEAIANSDHHHYVLVRITQSQSSLALTALLAFPTKRCIPNITMDKMAAVRPVVLRLLTTDQVVRLHRRYINPTGKATVALLESAMQSPVNHKHYTREDDVTHIRGHLNFNSN